MKVMFLDESGDHSLDKIDSSYPMFILAGCIFDFDYYSNVVEPEINKIKLKHFGKTDIILRSYDIRKQKKDFSCLVDMQKRKSFYEDLDSFIKNTDFKIIAAAIRKDKLKSQYKSPDNPYHLCLRFILERSIMYLGRTDEKLIFRIESRQTHNDEKLAEVYESFRNKDQAIFKKDEIQTKLVDLSFNQKSQNIIGMQIADLVAYPIGKWVLNSSKVNKAFEIIEKKFHKSYKSSSYLNYGLKIFP